MKTENTKDLSSFDEMVLSHDELMLLKGGQASTASVDCGWGCGGNCEESGSGCGPTEVTAGSPYNPILKAPAYAGTTEST